MWLLFCCIFQLKNPAICLKCCKKNFLIQNLMSIFAFWRLNSPFSLFEWHFIGPSSLILQTWNWHSAVDKDLAFSCTSPNLLYGKWLQTCRQRKIFQWPILHSGILYGKTGNDIGHRHVKSSIFVTQSRNKNCKVQSFLGCNYSFQCIQRRMTVFRPRDTLSAQSWRVNCGEKNWELEICMLFWTQIRQYLSKSNEIHAKSWEIFSASMELTDFFTYVLRFLSYATY